MEKIIRKKRHFFISGLPYLFEIILNIFSIEANRIWNTETMYFNIDDFFYGQFRASGKLFTNLPFQFIERI